NPTSLYVLNGSTGVELWRSASALGDAFTTVAVSGGMAIIGSNPNGDPSTPNVFGFTAGGCGKATCEPAWKAMLGGRAPSPIAVAGGVGYTTVWYGPYSPPSAPGTLYAFDITTGRTLWTASPANGKNSP